MNKKYTLLSIVVAFFLGCLVTYITMTKQQMDALLQAKKHSTAVHNASHSLADEPAQTTDVSNNGQELSQILADQKDGQDNKSSTKNDNQEVSINDYSEEQAKALINNMPDYVLGQYVDKFMTKDASKVIGDKRRFAERAVEELYKKNDNKPLVGEVKLSFDSNMPAASIDTTKINKNAKIYAHLDTRGQVPASPYVFVKWVNNETGQVLLFEKKDIVANSNQNWVSFIPYDGWQVGSYDIRFYQFTSELQPVAQLTYNIYEVIDDETQEQQSVVSGV